jgi:hypothetical protein
VDGEEAVEMFSGNSAYVGDVRRSYVCVDVFLRLPSLDDDKCAGR